MRTTTIETKDQWNSQASRRDVRSGRLVALFLTICLASGSSNAGTLRFYPPTKDEAGALLLAQIVHLATRDEILKLGVRTHAAALIGIERC